MPKVLTPHTEAHLSNTDKTARPLFRELRSDSEEIHRRDAARHRALVAGDDLVWNTVWRGRNPFRPFHKETSRP